MSAPISSGWPACTGSRETVRPSLLQMLDTFPPAAAYALSPSFDVLAMNAAVTALMRVPRRCRVRSGHPVSSHPSLVVPVQPRRRGRREERPPTCVADDTRP
ncbi:hypothetical protein [Streptomyces sp. NPDC058330]|uniref:MmyB family transcriptional regulator n=1 Tax=Streptomyces sp. NPDC058330 TaxID=3346449 RepID=UPI0036E28E30